MSAGYLVEYQVRVRNKADNADLLVVTSVQAGTNPYIKEPPKGDGASFNPMTNEQMAGSYTVLVVDAITSGTDRVVTAKLEDVNALLQLGYLKTYIEWRRDGGAWASLSVGYLVLLRLVDAATWELTVQDALRALDGVQLFNPSSTTTIAAFLAQWPTRGTVLGGPILNGFVGGGFPKALDLGGWRMRVRTFGPDLFGHTRYALTPVNVYGPPDFAPTHGHIGDYADVINQGVVTLPNQNESGTPSFTTVQDAQVGSAWVGLILLIDGVPFCPALPYYFPGTGSVRYIDPKNPFLLVSTDVIAPGLFARLHGQTPLVDGAVVSVRAMTVLPSSISPVYLNRHPVDLLSDLCTVAGVGFNDTKNVKHLFGDGLRVSLRITGQQSIGDLLRQAVFALGIGVYSDASGNITPFAMRKLANTPPTKTITDALVVEGSVSLPFEQDVSQGGLQRVTFRHKVLTQVGGPVRPIDAILGRVPRIDALDGVAERDQEFTEFNGDANPLLSGTVDITIPGMVRPDDLLPTPVDQAWVVGMAREFFEQFGRANPQAEFDLLRGDGSTDADTTQLGEEVLVAISQLPNHNKRLGDDLSVSARAMQLIRVTEEPSRRPARLRDSGPNAQPLATKPTLTIAASADLPRTVAELTITNAATLNGLGYAVRLQIALVAHGASAPATTAYSDLQMSRLAAIPTGAIRLLAAIAGSDVYVRARSELAGHRPSDWSAGVHVSLSLIDDPTSVAAAAVVGDGSLEDVTWVIGTNAATDVTDIYVRASTDPLSKAVRQAVLLAGSTRFRLFGLTPGATYKATVQHRDAQTGDVSDPIDVTFTTNAGVATLSAPTGPIGFSESVTDSSVFTGRYGLAVTATAFPSSVEFQEALETAVGSGAYGAYSTVGILPSVSGDFTMCTRTAPNDGLRRQLRARHVRDGATSSGWTATVVVTPWTYAPLPSFAVKPTATIALTDQTSRDITVTFDASVDPAQTPITWRYRLVRQGNYIAAWTSGVGALPQVVVFNRDAFKQASIELEVTQLDGTVASDSFPVQGTLIDVLSAGDGRLDEDDARSGTGGTSTSRGRIHVDTTYSDDGSTALIDTTTRRFTTDIFGPTGITSTVIERGGNKGDGAFTDLTGSMVTTGKDSRGALLNVMFRYGTDSAVGVVETSGQTFVDSAYLSSRRPKTIYDTVLAADVAGNDINVGQSRSRGGFTNATGALVGTAVDTRGALLNGMFRYGTDGAAGVVESGTQSFIHGSYIDGSRRPITLRDGSVDVVAADINVGQARARGGFTNSTGALVATAVDTRGALLNATFRLNTDTTDSVVDGTGSPISGGKRGQLGLNSSNLLVTGVHASAVGADGYANIESRRGAARQAGIAAGGLTGEDDARTGDAGVPTAGGRFSTMAIYDASGAQPIIDPLVIDALSSMRSLGSAKNRAKMTVSQSIANNTPTTALYASAIFDVGSITTPASGLITIPADYYGLWVVHVYVQWDANATGIRTVFLCDGGTAVAAGVSIVTPLAGGNTTTQEIVYYVNDPSGAIYSTKVTQTSGGNLNALVVMEAFHLW